MTYKYLIFDVDDTLLDFHRAFITAQRNIAEKIGIEYTKEYIELDDKCGWKAWGESGLDKTEEKEVQDNYHVYYYQYLRKHFTYLLQVLEMAYDEDELVDCYLKSIASSRETVEENTLQIYIKLAEHYQLVLATNGIEKVQKERLSDYLPYTHRTYISEAIGFIKPTKEFFEYMMNDLECNPKECLMIGDSITNDILGARAAGMDVCFYNIKNKVKPQNIVVDYEITSMQDLLQILL